MAKSMKVMYDFEFEEKYGVIDIISGGFVREDGKELYFVLNSFNTLSVAKNRWLMDNVMTSIKHEQFASHVNNNGIVISDFRVTEPTVSKSEARGLLLDFVKDIWPDFWAWYGGYDHVAMCSLFGSMIDLPANFPMFTQDIKQLHKQAGSPTLPKQPEGLHNALDDARFNFTKYNFLKEILSSS